MKYLKELTLYYDEFIEKNEEAIHNYNYIFKLDNVKIYDCKKDLVQHHQFILDTMDAQDCTFSIRQDSKDKYYIYVQSNSIFTVDVQEITLNGEKLPIEFNGRELIFYLPENLRAEDLSDIKVIYKPLYPYESEIKMADVTVGFEEEKTQNE